METLFIYLMWITIFVLPILIFVEVRRLLVQKTVLKRCEKGLEIVCYCLFLGGWLLYVTGSNWRLALLIFICGIPVALLWFIVAIINVRRKHNAI